ncbi:uncharacterized protein BCR38DRAFT_97794 [Pseudomassariella vexata]|uniref:Uncharacterized protein n=1 Tax=Pseudomassariella vexata TaxID=1141098 RepID=A0A1Y2EF39_9PEZI|nr:uncharacterized protein BCR38DRAFT_97794 [Pseudomassariella vexata]ORY70017.1 hypothetical protein BCR38DRAFT_97794 [Pseudomassariella vexata]
MGIGETCAAFLPSEAPAGLSARRLSEGLIFVPRHQRIEVLNNTDIESADWRLVFREFSRVFHSQPSTSQCLSPAFSIPSGLVAEHACSLTNTSCPAASGDTGPHGRHPGRWSGGRRLGAIYSQRPVSFLLQVGYYLEMMGGQGGLSLMALRCCISPECNWNDRQGYDLQDPPIVSSHISRLAAPSVSRLPFWLSL